MDSSNTVAALTSLANETRLEVFRLLVQVGGDGMPAGRIANALEVPPSSLSHHLKNLKYAGLISCRRDQRKLIYTANFGVMNGLLNFLLKDCCGGHPEICDPRADRISDGSSVRPSK